MVSGFGSGRVLPEVKILARVGSGNDSFGSGSRVSGTRYTPSAHMVRSVPWAGGQTPDMRPFFPLAHSSDRFPLPLIVNEAFPNLLVCMSRVNNDGKLAISNCFFCTYETSFVASCHLPLTVIIFPAQSLCNLIKDLSF